MGACSCLIPHIRAAVFPHRNLKLNGVECLAGFSELRTRVLLLLMVPFILLGMTVVTYVGVALWLRFRRPRAARRRASWLQDCSRALLFCFTSVYFPIVVTAVSMLPCSEDALGGQFMRAAPWVSCDSATRASLVGASSFALVVWGIGFPAGLGWYMWRHRKEDRMAGDLYGTVGCAPSCVPGLGCV